MTGPAMVHLNGALVPLDQALVPVTDRGFLYGDSIFETLRAYGGKPFAVPDHFDRLAASARAVGISLPFDAAGFSALLDDLLAANKLPDAMLRVTVSRGTGPSPVPDPTGCQNTTVVAMLRPAPVLDEAAWARGIHAVVAPVRATPREVLNPAIKSGNFLSHILAIAYAKGYAGNGASDICETSDVFEAILLDGLERVAEGAVSNVFGVWNGSLYTPSLNGDVLPGITRKVVMALAVTLDIPVQEGAIHSQELDDADELFVTNSGWEVMPVTCLNGSPLADGRAGPITRRLHAAYADYVRAATKG